MRSKIEEWFAEVKAEDFLSAPIIEVNSLENSRQLIQRGLGVAAFPTIAVREEIKSEKLIRLEVENFSVTADYFLGVDPSRDLSPAAFKFISLLKSSIKNKAI